MELNFIEIVGYIASGLVALSLSMKRILYLRIVNLVGAATFTVYGLAISAYPIVIVNIIIVMINLYFLYQLFTAKDYFDLLEVMPENRYLGEFLRYYGADIQRFFPGFSYQPKPNTLVFFVLRNLVPAGVFIGYQEGDQFKIDLDYVIEGYRDFKSGQYIYKDSRDVFDQRGIQRLVTTAGSTAHRSYLERIGFKPTGNDQYVREV